MRAGAALLLAIAVSGCTGNGSGNVARARAASWQQRLDRELPPGSTRAQVMAWAEAQDIHPVDGRPDRKIHMIFESVPEPKALIQLCRDWSISASIAMDATGRSVRNNVQTFGNCL